MNSLERRKSREKRKYEEDPFYDRGDRKRGRRSPRESRREHDGLFSNVSVVSTDSEEFYVSEPRRERSRRSHRYPEDRHCQKTHSKYPEKGRDHSVDRRRHFRFQADRRSDSVPSNKHVRVPREPTASTSGEKSSKSDRYL